MKHTCTFIRSHIQPVPLAVSGWVGKWVGRKIALALLLLTYTLTGSLTHGADRITASITFTNVGTTNGMTITVVANNTTVRTWTNSVTSPSSQIATNVTATGATTNLYNQLQATSPLGVAPILMGSPTNILLYGVSGVPLTVSFSVPAGPAYAAVTYTTNPVAAASYTLRFPNANESSEYRTNAASQLVAWLNLAAATNQLAQSQPAFAQLLGTTNAQTVTGAKTFTGVTIVSNAASIFYNGSISNALGISGVLAWVSNGVWYAGTISNAANISGFVRALTNGYWLNANLGTPTISNAAFYGNSSLLGTLDIIGTLGFNGLASYITADPGGDYFTIQPETGYALTVGTLGGLNGLRANDGFFTNDLFAETLAVTNTLARGPSTFANTNTFPAGSSLAFGRYSLTTLANGNNAALAVGTNIWAEISGNSGAAAICGISASPNRNGDFKILTYRQTYTLTIANESGLDPTPGNRIRTQTGADVSSAGACSLLLIYNATASRWDLLNLWSVESGISASTATNIVATSLTNNTAYAGVVVGLGIGTNRIPVMTNSSPVSPDFAKPVQLFATNAPFVFLAPANVDATKTQWQETRVYVTNNGASPFQVTAPANVHTLCTWFVTNLTEFKFQVYGGDKFTNASAIPWF